MAGIGSGGGTAHRHFANGLMDVHEVIVWGRYELEQTAEERSDGTRRLRADQSQTEATRMAASCAFPMMVGTSPLGHMKRTW